MSIRTRARQAAVIAVAATTLATTLATTSPTLALASGASSSSQAAPGPLDPSAMERGENPAISYLVRDTIRDGDLRIPATRRVGHEALFNVARGYVVEDFRRGSPAQNIYRLTFVSRNGEKKVIAREASRAAVSEDGTRVAWSRDERETAGPSVVRVANPATGRIVETRRFRTRVGVVAVTADRVLVSRLYARRGTFVWNYERGTRRSVSDESAVGVDLANDRIVFDVPRDAPACVRVARFSRPGPTLWRSCRWYPHEWSPNGDLALATHTYFDAAGTDRWLVLDGRTGKRLHRVTGRLDWDATWEDDSHFLTMAQGEDGQDAIVRCEVAGGCERASRLWDIGLPEQSVFYAGPPVVLSE